MSAQYLFSILSDQKKIVVSTFLLTFLFPFCIVAKEIIISDSFSYRLIADQVLVFEDKTKTLDLAAIQQLDTHQFIPSTTPNLSFGYRRNSNMWVKINLVNKSTIDQSLILNISNSYVRYIDCYILKDNKLNKHFNGGMQNTFNTRPILNKTPAFPITLPSNKKTTVYLKFDWKWDSAQMPLKLYTENIFLDTQQREYWTLGIIVGLLGFIVVSAFVVYSATGLRLFLFYLLYSFFRLYYIINITGIAYHFIYPKQPTFAHHILLINAVLLVLAFYVMVVEFYKNLPNGLHFNSWHTKFVSCLGLISLGVAVFQGQLIHYQFSFPPGLGIFLIMLTNTYLLIKMAWVQKTWISYLFLIGYLGWIGQGLLFVFVNNSILRGSLEDHHIHLVTMVLEVACLSIIMVHRIYSTFVEKQQLSNELVTARLEKQQADKIKELDIAKTRLYTNITHEFRTPLTIIKGLTEQLEGDSYKKNLIQRNSDILLRLVDQMLSLSKADKGELKLTLIQNDIISYLHYLSESFTSWAMTKNIRLHFLPEMEVCVMDYDADKLQEVLSNLLSNAIKFTQDRGDIYLFIKQVENDLLISVKDTGKGIKTEQLPNIFDLFYQAEHNENKGTGIGLALCQQLVQLMNGKIEVQSTSDKGSTFTIYLPISHNAPLINKKLPTNTPQVSLISTESNTVANKQKIIPKDIPIVLIVEDNKDVIFYIQSCLENQYQLLLAENGKQGMALALEHIPDIILSDVMMPNTSGLELCEQLKFNRLTSHIPIILLTAKAEEEDKIRGLAKGADAYLIKPFNKEELRVRIEQLIQQRKRIQSFFLSNDKQIATKQYRIESKFLIQLRKVITKNLSNDLFDVQYLSREIGMSRSQVYRKLKALTGRSIADYIRYVRLQEGKRQLESTELTISEIAFAVGFKDLSYFSRSFSQEFGFPPGATRK